MSRTGILTLASLLVACALGAAGCVTPVSEAEVEDKLERAAEPFAALGRRRIIPIYAETNFIAKALVTEARANPESPLAVRVGKRLGIAARRDFHVVIGGPYPELTDRILRNAMLLNRETGLSGLTVVYVSDARPSPQLQQEARAVHARLHHVALP